MERGRIARQPWQFDMNGPFFWVWTESLTIRPEVIQRRCPRWDLNYMWTFKTERGCGANAKPHHCVLHCCIVRELTICNATRNQIKKRNNL